MAEPVSHDRRLGADRTAETDSRRAGHHRRIAVVRLDAGALFAHRIEYARHPFGDVVAHPVAHEKRREDHADDRVDQVERAGRVDRQPTGQPGAHQHQQPFEKVGREACGEPRRRRPAESSAASARAASSPRSGSGTAARAAGMSLWWNNSSLLLHLAPGASCAVHSLSQSVAQASLPGALGCRVQICLSGVPPSGWRPGTGGNSYQLRHCGPPALETRFGTCSGLPNVRHEPEL